jgi:hypothetical protein
MAGYSGTPLVRKLGIKEGHRIALIDAPPDFHRTLGELPQELVIETDRHPNGKFDVMVFFVDRRSELHSRFPALATSLVPSGGLWVAWPKKISGVATDLTEDIIRAIGLEAGLVDNKVCAVDDTWSGLRFVIRLKDRPKKVRGQP